MINLNDYLGMKTRLANPVLCERNAAKFYFTQACLLLKTLIHYQSSNDFTSFELYLYEYNLTRWDKTLPLQQTKYSVSKVILTFKSIK